MQVNQKSIVKAINAEKTEEPIFSVKKDGRRLIIITCMAVLMALNIRCLVHGGGLYPGGATGATLLLQKIFHEFFHARLPYTLINVILNAIPVYIGYRYVGKKLTIYSVYMIMLTNILTDILPVRPITDDIMLVSLFGGLINGVVISVCLMQNANTGGTDFISLYFSEKKGIDGFNISLGINGVILVCAGILFGLDKAMYSILFQYISTQMIHTLYRRYQKVTMLIVTDHPEQVCTAITRVGNHGATVLQGEGAYEGRTHTMIYSVVSRPEAKQITKVILETDPGAFINVIGTEQLTGRFYSRPME
ncbi:MAG: YitT family protein [Chordicoccus sp.]